MSIDFLQIACAAVMIVLISVALRDIKREYAVVLSVCGAVLLLIWGISNIEPIAEKMLEFTQASGIDDSYSEILFKALGISVSTRTVRDICCDAGESAIASKVDFCGRITLLLISLPLFEKLLDIAADIISS